LGQESQSQAIHCSRKQHSPKISTKRGITILSNSVKFAADQGLADAQHNCVSKHFRAAAHSFQLAADQGHPDAQYDDGICFVTINMVDHDYSDSPRDLKDS
jgi:hypothetical protein